MPPITDALTLSFLILCVFHKSFCCRAANGTVDNRFCRQRLICSKADCTQFYNHTLIIVYNYTTKVNGKSIIILFLLLYNNSIAKEFLLC